MNIEQKVRELYFNGEIIKQEQEKLIIALAEFGRANLD